MATLVAKNWGEFQHYKDRAPAWIKLHKRLLDDFEYQSLPLASRALAPMLWLLASEENDGTIDFNPKKLAFRLRTTVEEINEAVKPLIENGFFSLIGDCNSDASDLLAEVLPREEKRREEEEIEKERDVAQSAPPSQPLTPEVVTVFEFWKATMDSPRSLLDKKRTASIKAALKTGYTVEQLCDAITGCSKSAFHMGENDRGVKYNGLDLILRNAEHIDKFIVIGQSPIQPVKVRKTGYVHDLSTMDYTKGVDEDGRF